MDAHRKTRLQQLINDRFGGDRAAFGKEVELTKGRVSQLLDPDLPFGERAARTLTTKLSLPDRWFELQPGQHTAREPEARYETPMVEDEFTIPQYAAGGAMGHGLVLEEKQPGLIKSWRVDHEWLRLNVRHHTGVQNLCIVTGLGPSMKPKYNPGDPLLLDRGVNTVETEGIYFFRVGQHGFIKQLQRIPTEAGMIIRAKSLNGSYDPFDITAKMDFEVFGKVLTVWKSEQV
jgi:phage repressor protein C with HTH and peptisase S24 domain